MNRARGYAVFRREESAMAKKPGPRRDVPRSAPILDSPAAGEEHRQFPRAQLEVPFLLWIDEDSERRFSATLRSVNLSVSGAFLESTFFLPVGTQLSVAFSLEEGGERVEARAEIIREERVAEESEEERTGMGLRFLEFFGQTEVTLAKLFLGRQLQAFAEGYLQSKRAKSLKSELDRVVDALAAWELRKVTNNQDTWRTRAGEE
jgi:hypothetical protein